MSKVLTDATGRRARPSVSLCAKSRTFSSRPARRSSRRRNRCRRRWAPHHRGTLGAGVRRPRRLDSPCRVIHIHFRTPSAHIPDCRLSPTGGLGSDDERPSWETRPAEGQGLGEVPQRLPRVSAVHRPQAEGATLVSATGRRSGQPGCYHGGSRAERSRDGYQARVGVENPPKGPASQSHARTIQTVRIRVPRLGSGAVLWQVLACPCCRSSAGSAARVSQEYNSIRGSKQTASLGVVGKAIQFGWHSTPDRDLRLSHCGSHASSSSLSSGSSYWGCSNLARARCSAVMRLLFTCGGLSAW
ncbi:hypothetical protein LY78DRAFT_246470 [Colletotrichum sublineola]|nr:hypothetical protein LY78DRAFT_246470 [Colletotrichum sublineola]